ncbi:hypothetical protein TH66_06940 [Carbonactinospora thermoautotrophica]|uniref:DUF3099 domain-containing protein n=1 Tax=Carbonactinospora thermoautotrophica TaxID=1469144 RepID=A0A132N4G9_9ACTN|nr:DUF3099 domain-containing protein [Carbonactinospora thermoautotrophica]KWX04342.1 hypothetical protein TH66_06940 [Carbonactinospora thermoautotrophica]KWX04927.1 hypothetical protein TR74_24095 [Carbonactinospora thermoautotrophica]
MKTKGAKPAVYQITGARKSLSEDVAYRQRRYLISMSIRTVCFVLAVVFHGPMRWIMFVAALTLPYFAVVFANGGRERAPESTSTYLPIRPELGPGENHAESSPRD